MENNSDDCIRGSVVDDNYNTRYQDKEDYNVSLGKYHDKDEKSQKHFYPTQGERVKTWLARLGMAVYEAKEKNIAIHINGPKGPWYTHRSGGSCFLCDDVTFIRLLHNCIVGLSKVIDLDVYEWYLDDTSWSIRPISS